MKKTLLTFVLTPALLLSLSACAKAPVESPSPAVEPQTQATEALPTEAAPVEAAPTEAAPVETVPVRQDGERFEDTIMLEGMEETVQYEHIRNAALGIEMDYDYENFVRCSDENGERFVSDWDDPANPENYMELRADSGNANLVADVIIASLSGDYEILQENRDFGRAGQGVQIEASVIKGNDQMDQNILRVYVIPAPDGCRVATVHCFIAESEGYTRRFGYMLDTLSVFPREQAPASGLTDEQALSAIRSYCASVIPDVEEMAASGDYSIYWAIADSSDEQIVVVFRSYTGSLNRYYIDRATGDAYITEFVPGITPAEERSDESLNVWAYVR